MTEVWRFGRVLDDVPALLDGPDWRQADPRWIARALALTQARSHGGWFVLDGSRAITHKPRKYRVLGTDYVAFRDDEGVIVGPDACPHMGASLADGHVQDGCVRCPWHGLALGRTRRGAWVPLPIHDDGVLVWVQPPVPGQTMFDAPVLPRRPDRFLEGVMRMEATCLPSDVVANRLDPWHGAHYHPHSFATLKVLDQQDDAITVRVAYRVAGPLAVEVDAVFDSPEPHSIVMTIVDGEGKGSVVETHATPIEGDRTAIVEATLATSERPGFHWAVRWMGWAIRPFVEARARRLWVEDAAYAERVHELRLLAARKE